MSSLHFIKQVESDNVVTLSATDVFSSNYDVYEVFYKINGNSTTNANQSVRLIDSGGVVTLSNYASGAVQMTTYNNAFGALRYNGQSAFIIQGYERDKGVGNRITIYNPYDNDAHTFINWFSAGSYAGNGISIKGAGSYGATTQFTGIEVNANATSTIHCSIYGVK
jgi:hypothetical protein